MRLAQVIGQDRGRRLLQRMLTGDRFPHALLLEGRRGTGRSTLGAALAQALLCAQPEAGDACGHCPDCRAAAAGSHPDLVLLDRSPKALQVEAIRATVIEQAAVSPLQARRRVFGLWDIESLHPAAANALLKVMEEPPPQTHLIMSKLPGPVVLPTILSRCHRLRLADLTPGEVERILVRQGVEGGQARRLAGLGGGSHHGLDEARQVAECPLQELRAMLHRPFDQQRIAAVVAALPAHSNDERFTDAAWQRRTCRWWLDQLLAAEREQLRRGGAPATARAIEQIAAIREDLALNLQPRQIIERLALLGEARSGTS